MGIDPIIVVIQPMSVIQDAFEGCFHRRTDSLMKKILYCTSDSFPYGSAYASRLRALSMLFQELGYEVDILCDFPGGSETTERYGHIFYASDKSLLGLRKMVELPVIYNRKLKNILHLNTYSAIVLRSMFDRFDIILRTVRKHHVPVILETCEWYDVKGFARQNWDIRYLQFQHCFHSSYNKADAVIAISRLLEEHYKNKGKPVVRIPAVLETDTKVFRTSARDDDEVRIMFAGSVFGGKEQFSEIFNALLTCEKHGKRLIFNIYGPTKEEIVSGLDEHGVLALNQLGPIVVFHGKVPQEKMGEICADNDYAVFFRPDRRSSHAGFPTKLGEYLAAGTPVITNNTGDIQLVLKNGYDGWVLEETKTETIRRVLETCICFDREQQENLRKNAREAAIKKLDYVAYKDEMDEFLRTVIR